eukprot:1462995-Amphidinium_carterae.1
MATTSKHPPAKAPAIMQPPVPSKARPVIRLQRPPCPGCAAGRAASAESTAVASATPCAHAPAAA